MTTTRYQCAIGKAPVRVSAATAIKGQGMVDLVAGKGKDLLSPDGTMRAKRVTMPATEKAWTEVDELTDDATVIPAD